MKRFDVTTVKRLQIGDRFYKKSDKTKEPHQVMDPEQQIRTKAQKHFACPVSALGSKVETQKTVPIAAETDVIFLRNSNSVNLKQPLSHV